MYLTPFNTPWSLWSNESFDTKHQIFRHEHWQAQFWAIPNEQHWYINIAQFFSDPGIDILEINSDCLPCWYCENQQQWKWRDKNYFFSSLASSSYFKMKSIIFIFALVLAVALAAPKPAESNEHDFGNLTKDQRLCIIDKVKADPTIMAALKTCHKTGGGLDCVKAIPQLVSCFA